MCQVQYGVDRQTQVAAKSICMVVVAVVTGWALTRLAAVGWAELAKEMTLLGVGLGFLASVGFVFQ